MEVFDLDLELTGLDGRPLDVAPLLGRAVLVVNVASKCGLTPQYAGLENLQGRFGPERFTVLGAPCNQFAGQEPGSAEEIGAFCSATYGTTFPLTEKLDVNGRARHRLFERLRVLPDSSGRAGDVEWNFEKFLVAPGGAGVARFRPLVEPESHEVVAAIESVLGGGGERWESVLASEVRPGDRVRPRPGIELTATRIEEGFFGDAESLALIEDSPAQWLKAPTRRDARVEVLRSPAQS